MKRKTGNDEAQPEKARVVEIVGPAGAGKTTLYKALNRYAGSIRLENFPDVHKVADAPFFISNGLQLLPGLLHIHRSDSRQLTRREFAWMMILHGWPALLNMPLRGGNKIIILDQGPVYLLAEMRLFGPEYLKRKTAEDLWQGLYQRWSSTLHTIVYLDAADDILLARIRNRQQEHMVKSQPAAIVYQFLNRYRIEYEFILSTLKHQKTSLKVLRFDTNRQQPLSIADQFLSELQS